MTSSDYPQKIDKYKIQSILGQGAMGVVYKGYDSEIDRFVAIKVLHKHLLDGDMADELEQRFKHEVKAAAKCLHQNIVTVFDCGMCHERPYMVMEYVQGVDLRIMLKSGYSFTYNQAIEIVSKTLDALYAAHQLGVVHRDIKPANILLLENGVVKVTDFGVARIDSSDLTQIGDVIGTPSYMSPEANRGAQVDGRSDLYSAALVLLELLTHKRIKPSEIHASAINSSLQKLPLTALQKDHLSQTLVKALSSNPSERFQTAVEFSKALLSIQISTEAPYQQSHELAETIIQLRTKLPKEHPVQTENSQLSCLSQLNKDELSLVEKSLTQFIGPIAKVMLKKQAKNSPNIVHLLDSLASHISSVKDRNAFIKSIQSTGFFKKEATSISNISAAKAGTSQPSISAIKLKLKDNELAQLTSELTRYLGPVAKHMIKKNLKHCSCLEELHLSLADKIPDEKQRTQFLAHCGNNKL